MATIQEAKTQLAQQQQRVQQQRQQIQQQQLQKLSREQLLSQTLQQRNVRRTQKAEFQQQKQTALEQLKKFETEKLAPYEAEIKKVENQQVSQVIQPSAKYQEALRQQGEWTQAESIIARGSRYDPRSAVGIKIQKIHKQREEAQAEIDRVQKELESPSVEVPSVDSPDIWEVSKRTGTYIRDAEHKAEIEKAYKELSEGTYTQPDISKLRGYKGYPSSKVAEAVTEKIDPVIQKVSMTLSPLSKGAEEYFTATEIRTLQTPTFLKQQPYPSEVGATAYIEPRQFTRKELESMPFKAHEIIQKNVEADIQNRARQLQLDYQSQLQGNYQERYNKAVQGATTKQKKQDVYDQVNLEYSKEIQRRVEEDLSPEIQEAEQYLEELGIKGRRMRAGALAPFVFAESYALGFGLSKGIGAIGKVSTIAGKTAEVGTTAGFGVMIASSGEPLVESFEADPFSFALETAPVITGFARGSGVKMGVLEPRVRTLEIPQAKGGMSKINLLGFETKRGGAFILGSEVGGKIGFGTPDIIPILERFPHRTDIKVGSALETKTLQKSLISPQLKTTLPAQKLIPITQDILKLTRKTPSKFIDPFELRTATERLSPEAVEVVLDIARKEGGVLFGSKSRAFQLAKDFEIKGEKFKLEKVPRDIEVRFDIAGETKLQEITTKTISELKKLGKQKVNDKTIDLSTTREIKYTPFAIESKLNGEYIKIIEYKGEGGLLEGEIVPEFVVGIKKVGEPIKIDGMKATALAEELRGVTQGVVRIRRVEGTNLLDISPSPKRMKDIGSVSVTARTLELSRPSTKLKRKIVEFESFFPEELVREQVRKVLTTPEKIKIVDFSPTNLLKGKSISPVISFSSKAIKSPTIYSKIKSPTISKGASPSLSPKVFPSISPKVSPSVSPKVSPSVSPYKSPSVSPKVSPYKSPYKSPKVSPSISPKVSPSVSPKVSPSVSPYKSPSKSPSVSPKISPSISPYKIGIRRKAKHPKRRRIKKTKSSEYTPEIKRYGKWKPISKPTTKAKAKKLAVSKIESGLGASLRVQKNKKSVPLKVPKGFRKSKTNPFVLVEKRNLRLSSKGERKEIKQAKRRK